MSPIRVLDQTLIDQIAAGEVIVRPASVAKELAENSLDAGATRISVEMDRECLSIRVADDGAGIEANQVELAVLRHATSKIAALEDLARVATRGFRGEALASIAAVSRFTLTSRPPHAVAGTRLRAEGGAIVETRSVGCPPGTTVEVEDLFFNTPARRKFMKSPAAEWARTQDALICQALAAPHVGFCAIHAGRKAWEAPPGQTLRNRIAQLLGTRVADSLLAVEQESDGVAYEGFVSKPGEDRADHRLQYFFVNGRPIGSQKLAGALQAAYKGLIMTRRFPIAVLRVALDPAEVDVNVHPTKDEVRFRDERKVSGLMHRAVAAALRGANFAPVYAPPAGSWTPATAAAGPIAPGAADPTLEWMFGRGKTKSDSSWPPAPGAPPGPGGGPKAAAPRPPAAESDASDAASGIDPGALAIRSAILESGLSPRPIGQVGQAYIVAELGDDLLLIDQHAAHERTLYARALKRSRTPDAQTLLIPIDFEAAPGDVDSLKALIPRFAEMGIEIEPFGGRHYLIRSLPVDFEDLDIAGAIQDMLDLHAQSGKLDADEAVRDTLLTRLACRGAVKSGQRLAPEEMRRLIDDVLATPLAFTCPHGRPTMILLTKDQLDKQFKRE